MRRVCAVSLLLMLCILVLAQEPNQQKGRPEEVGQDDVVRISTELVQTDVVVVDGNDRVIPDLKLEDFDVYDNGKKQELKFMEYVSAAGEKRTEGKRQPLAGESVPDEVTKEVSAKDVKRILAFIVDDLTIPLEDLQPLRNMLLDFVNNKMHDGDLVAIIRVVGGKGLLQQFTSDRAILRQAIADIHLVSHPFAVQDTPEPGRIQSAKAPEIADAGFVDDLVRRPDINSPSDDVNQFFRGLSTLASAGYVIDSLKEIPGHKNVIIISGGIPLFEPGTTGSAYTNTTYWLNRLSDAALRAGVVINTFDPRGMNATPGVVSFTQTPGRSNYESEMMGQSTGFGRGGNVDTASFGPMLAGGSERLGLSTVANATGGVSMANTNDFSSALDKILARAEGYYLLAYTPNEKFDQKFHKLEIKVHRGGAKVLHHSGYAAREEKAKRQLTKEEEIVRAARSPLARRDIEVTPNVAMKLTPEKATVDIDLLIDANKLNFNEAGGRYQTSLDVVGFVLDQLGKQRGGFSETINLNLTKEDYHRALSEGLTYSATTELPPGYYQIRSVVRESSSGSLGTFSRYLEIPDLKRDKLAMSSLFFFAVDPSSNPRPLTAIRAVPHNQDLRFAAIIYNAKLKGGKPSLRSQMIISKDGNVLLREPEQDVPPPTDSSRPVAKIGQFGVSRMSPGHYLLTLIITDTLADKKYQTVSHSLDFTVLP